MIEARATQIEGTGPLAVTRSHNSLKRKSVCGMFNTFRNGGLHSLSQVWHAESPSDSSFHNLTLS